MVMGLTDWIDAGLCSLTFFLLFFLSNGQLCYEFLQNLPCLAVLMRFVSFE